MTGPIPEEIIADVLGRANIVEVIGEHLQLRKIGNGHQGLCPFHSDSKPSFYVNEARQFFHCFGCGVGGNIFHFLMRTHGLTFPEAVRSVAERVGVRIPEREFSKEEQRRRDQRTGLVELNELAAGFFRDALRAASGADARRYLQSRGMSRDTEETFGLGFAPPGWRGLVDHLRARTASLPQAEAAGLILPGKGGGYYDRFRGRLVFPIHDEAGRVIGFGARTLGDDLPKYINTPDSPVFSKGKNLYGLYMARASIRQGDAVVVVEGYTDLLALHQAGIRHVVATLGTALTRDHLQRLRRYTGSVIHVFDGDEAGERATLRALDLCLESGSWGRVLRLPASHDPDSYVRQVGGEAFGKELEGAISLMDYMIQKAVASTDLSRVESKVQALKQVVPRIQRLSDRVAVDHYAAMLADRLRISEARIHELIRGGSPGPAHAASGESRAREGFQQERLLLKAILKEPSLAGSLRGELAKEFQDRNYRALAEMIARWEEEGERWDVRVLEERIHDPDLAGSLAQLQANIGEIGESPERVCEQCMNYLKAMRIGREIHRVKQALTEAEKQGDKEQRTVLELQLKTLLHEKKARLRMSA